ncbi:hypothetical protein GOV13_05725 [Candidatus Pacearchaeota archaeon]|nr:hypothetical protein [Candidatus Pacearchaeota archaeon]
MTENLETKSWSFSSGVMNDYKRIRDIIVPLYKGAKLFPELLLSFPAAEDKLNQVIHSVKKMDWGTGEEIIEGESKYIAAFANSTLFGSLFLAPFLMDNPKYLAVPVITNTISYLEKKYQDSLRQSPEE